MNKSRVKRENGRGFIACTSRQSNTNNTVKRLLLLPEGSKKNENGNDESIRVTRTRNENENKNENERIQSDVHNSDVNLHMGGRSARFVDKVNSERFNGKEYKKIMYSIKNKGIYGYDEKEMEIMFLILFSNSPNKTSKILMNSINCFSILLLKQPGQFQYVL